MTFIIVLGLLLVSILLTLKFYELTWKNGLTAEVRFDQQQLVEGENCHIIEKVENRKWLPIPALNVKFQLDRSITYKEKENTAKTDKQYRSDCITMLPHQRVTRTFAVKCEKRGLYFIDRVDLVAADLFYTELLTATEDNQTTLYVLPKKSDSYQVKAEYDRMMGDIITNRFLYDDPFAFKGIRDYAPTDPMKRINWKSSAKTGELKVNQYYSTSSQQVILFLNMDYEGIFVQDQLLEESIRIARNYLEWFIGAGIPVKLYSNGIDIVSKEKIVIQQGVGAGHMENCLKQLSRLTFLEPLEPMQNIFGSIKEQDPKRVDSVTVLITVSQEDKLIEAYDAFVGEGERGKILIPIYPDGIRKQKNTSSALSKIEHADVAYLEFGRS